MNKNSNNLYPFLILDQLGHGVTGQTPSVYLRQDGGSFTAATNSVSEVSAQNEPGLYQITLTATECNCAVLTIKVTLPDGQDPAILDVVYLGGSGGATPQEIWEYSGGRTVDNTIPSASDTAGAVWGASTRTLTASPTDVSGLATSSALSSVASDVSAVKAKTDNLPASPAAVGSAMTLTAAYDAAKTAAPTAASVASAVWGASTRTITAIPSTVADLLNEIHALLGDWTMGDTTLTTTEGNYTLTRDTNGNITAITPASEEEETT